MENWPPSAWVRRANGGKGRAPLVPLRGRSGRAPLLRLRRSQSAPLTSPQILGIAKRCLARGRQGGHQRSIAFGDVLRGCIASRCLRRVQPSGAKAIEPWAQGYFAFVLGGKAWEGRANGRKALFIFCLFIKFFKNPWACQQELCAQLILLI